MKKLFFFILLINIFFYGKIKTIKRGVYNIRFNQYYLEYYKNKILLSDYFKYPNTFFRISKKYNNSGKTYYFMENVITNNKIYYNLSNNQLAFSKEKNNKLFLWNFIKLKNDKYIIRNENDCYITINKFGITCKIIPFEEACQFDFIKIYEEVLEKKHNNILIEKEPIDVLIKYIDLRDPNLKRAGIHQIEKDYDNEELKYSIRSILKNISWIRKIFILMPNDNVRYFKNYSIIKDKIVYVKDKDLLGYDSSDSNSFQYRYWKMKKFGISDNFIIMDDDYFIGKKLKKTDFFYIEKGRVVPSIITSYFIKIDYNNAKQNYDLYKSKAINSKEEQNDDIFKYSLYLTYLFIMKIFNKSLNDSITIPKFTHNAIPVNLKDLKRIYNIVYNSEHKSVTLDSLYRGIGFVQFQTLYLSYFFIKYKRKIRNIPYKFIRINDTILSNYKYSLFCINKGPFNYSYLIFYKAKLLMEYLFPIPTIYEKVDYSLSNISFNIAYSMEKSLKNYEGERIKFKKIKENNWIMIIIILINFILITIKKMN